MADIVEHTDSLTAVDKLSSDMKSTLDLLDSKVESVVTQVETVRKTRKEILTITRKLQDSLRECGKSRVLDPRQEERLQVISSEVSRREEVLRALEKREMLLSHSMLNAINDWMKGVTESEFDHEAEEVEQWDLPDDDQNKQSNLSNTDQNEQSDLYSDHQDEQCELPKV